MIERMKAIASDPHVRSLAHGAIHAAVGAGVAAALEAAGAVTPGPETPFLVMVLTILAHAFHAPAEKT